MCHIWYSTSINWYHNVVFNWYSHLDCKSLVGWGHVLYSSCNLPALIHSVSTYFIVFYSTICHWTRQMQHAFNKCCKDNDFQSLQHLNFPKQFSEVQEIQELWTSPWLCFKNIIFSGFELENLPRIKWLTGVRVLSNPKAYAVSYCTLLAPGKAQLMKMRWASVVYTSVF